MGFLLGEATARRELADLHDLPINYALEPGEVPDRTTGWDVDEYSCHLADETPGEPAPGAAYDVACRLVRDYEFADPAIIKAVWLPDSPLAARDMLFEARFLLLRFFIGVRVSEVVDERVDTPAGPERAWGYCYRTLQGHFEMGEMCYRVVKNIGTGAVEFRMRRYVRTGAIPSPLLRLGWATFGRYMQVRFVKHAMERMQRLVAAELTPGQTEAPVPLAAEQIKVGRAADDVKAAERIPG